jgi:hypothetical protein
MSASTNANNFWAAPDELTGQLMFYQAISQATESSGSSFVSVPVEKEFTSITAAQLAQAFMPTAFEARSASGSASNQITSGQVPVPSTMFLLLGVISAVTLWKCFSRLDKSVHLRLLCLHRV